MITSTLLLSAHLLFVNLATGGPLVAAWLDWRGTRGDNTAAGAAVRLARWSLAAFAIGALLGLAMGWERWDAAYQRLWTGPLSYKLHWAVVELVFSAVLLVGWWLWLPGIAGGRRWAAITRGFVAVLASTNLLYHFPILFSVAARLHASGYEGPERINGAAFRRLMSVAESPALAVHVALASIAVTGVALIAFALREPAADGDDAGSRQARWGAWWALVSSLAQLPVGLWTLSALPADAQTRIMGESTVGILLFVAAIGASLWLLNDLAHVAFGETARSRLWRTIAAMLFTILLMTAMQQQARDGARIIRSGSTSVSTVHEA